MCCPKSKSCCWKFIWSLLRIMFIFISLLKFHGQASRRMEASSFSRQQTFLRWGPNRDVRFNLATLFNLRAISLTWCAGYPLQSQLQVWAHELSIFLKSCIDNNMNFQTHTKDFLNTFHDYLKRRRVNALLALRSQKKTIFKFDEYYDK